MWGVVVRLGWSVDTLLSLDMGGGTGGKRALSCLKVMHQVLLTPHWKPCLFWGMDGGAWSEGVEVGAGMAVWNEKRLY